MDEDLREVEYWKYCEKCKHKDLPENEFPCLECLDIPVNQYTSEPVKYEEQETKKGTRSK